MILAVDAAALARHTLARPVQVRSAWILIYDRCLDRAVRASAQVVYVARTS